MISGQTWKCYEWKSNEVNSDPALFHFTVCMVTPGQQNFSPQMEACQKNSISILDNIAEMAQPCNIAKSSCELHSFGIQMNDALDDYPDL